MLILLLAVTRLGCLLKCHEFSLWLQVLVERHLYIVVVFHGYNDEWIYQNRDRFF
jgi:hypothetical protein